MTRIAINGLGRIGRAFLKLAIDHPALDVVAANDVADADNLAYLMRYDSVYGPARHTITAERSGEATFLRVGEHRGGQWGRSSVAQCVQFLCQLGHGWIDVAPL